MEDQAFNKLVEQVNTQLTQLHDQVAEFEQNSKDVDASIGQDVTDLRDEITTNLQQVQQIIQRIENNAGHLNTRQQKLKTIKQFYKKEIDKFTQVCKLMERQLNEKRRTITANQKWNEPKPEPVNQLQEELLYTQHDVDNQLIRERNDEVQKIDQQAQLLHKLVGELAMEVDKQDQNLIIIDKEQIDTIENVKKANAELDKAQNSQSSANKKLCVLALCAIIVVAILVIFLVIKLK